MSTQASERSQSQVTQLGQISVAARYAQMRPEDFGNELQKQLVFLQAQAQLLTEHVEQGNILPIDASKSWACVTGSMTGYEEYHPRTGISPDQQIVQQGFVASALSGADTSKSR